MISFRSTPYLRLGSTLSPELPFAESSFLCLLETPFPSLLLRLSDLGLFSYFPLYTDLVSVPFDNLLSSVSAAFEQAFNVSVNVGPCVCNTVLRTFTDPFHRIPSRSILTLLTSDVFEIVSVSAICDEIMRFIMITIANNIIANVIVFVLLVNNLYGSSRTYLPTTCITL